MRYPKFIKVIFNFLISFPSTKCSKELQCMQNTEYSIISLLLYNISCDLGFPPSLLVLITCFRLSNLTYYHSLTSDTLVYWTTYNLIKTNITNASMHYDFLFFLQCSILPGFPALKIPTNLRVSLISTRTFLQLSTSTVVPKSYSVSWLLTCIVSHLTYFQHLA